MSVYAIPRYQAVAPPLPGDVRLLQGTAQVVIALAVLVLLATGLAWLLRLPALELRSIRVEGDVGRNSASTIRANALPQLRGNFLTMDLEQARAAFQSVPWVRRAIVRREWPMRLSVRLEEHRPAALWGADEDTERLVNTHGEVFEAQTDDLDEAGLTRLAGPDGSSAQMLAMVRRLAKVLEPLDNGALQLLALSPRGSWRVLLDSGATLELGRGTEDEVVARTERFVRTLPRVLAAYQRPLQSADLRHIGGFAVKLKGITTVLPPAPTPASARRR